jgi:uncharacterized YccA/Bax inhibitor family protein
MQTRTSNPALSDLVFEREALRDRVTEVMTLNGTVVKTGILVAILVFVAGISGALTYRFLGQPVSDRPVWLFVGLFGAMLAALIVAVITTAKPKVAPVTAPIYAAVEGWAIGGLSGLFEDQYAGIVVQAAALTVGVLLALLAAYVSRLIRPTENFKLMVTAATGGLFLVYAVSLLFSLFGVRIPYIHDYGIVGIGFSLFAVAIASFNLVLHFDYIENGVRRRAPKYMEWYAGFGLLVTLVWLYLEILELLAKLRRRSESS